MRLTRFDREARMLASVNHPALAAIYGLEESAGTRYIVMELVPGETLSESLARGPMPLRAALGAARQIAEGLEAAHEKGIVHRDLKPSNIKITPEGRVKVLDLGLAKAMDARAEEPAGSSESPTVQLDETRPGVIVGTIEFMSPEQARGKAVDKRTDVWAFGCVLFEMLSGHRAFSGETPSDIIVSILTREPDWAALPESTPPRVRELLGRCLQKDASHRLRDVGDARIALEDAITESAERPAPASAGAARSSLVVPAALAVLAAAAGLWLALRPRPPGPAGQQSLAVLPFRDLSGQPGGQLLGDALGETVSSRLANVPGVRVVTPPEALASFSRQPSGLAGIARELGTSAAESGARLILRGAVQRQGDLIRITYSVWNTQTKAQVVGGDVTGAASDPFGIQDRLVDQLAAKLGLAAPSRRTLPASQLLTAGQQERYLMALGSLQRYDDPESVEAARQRLEALSREAPESALVQAALARACFHEYTLTHERSWADQAIAASARATRLDAGLSEVHLTRGMVLRATGKGNEAIGELQIALSQAPDSLEGLFGLADAYESVGRNADAEATLLRAIALQPGYWAVYNQLGTLYYRTGRYGKASEMFRRVVERIPDSVRGWNNLGASYQQADRFDEARAAYKRSAGVRPNDGAFTNLGVLEFFTGHYTEAVAAFEQAATLTPGKALYWSNLGDAYRWAPGMRPRAVAAYARAIALERERLSADPQDADAWSTLGLCLAKTGKTAEGLAAIEKALALEPGNLDHFYNAAVVSTLLGRTDDAIGWLRQAVDGGMGVRQIEAEPEFQQLRKLDAFKKVFESHKEAA